MGFRGLLFHEYAHALFHRATRGASAPTWLNEGLAEYARLRGDPGPAVICLPSSHSYPLRDLHGSFGQFGRYSAHFAYLEARHATERFIERYREEGMRSLLSALATEPDFPQAFRRATGQEYQAFARAFDGELH